MFLRVILISFFALFVNLPFGYLRNQVQKYSVKWFIYLHLPIPTIVFFRIYYKVNFKYIPLFILTSILGQIIGAGLNKNLMFKKN